MSVLVKGRLMASGEEEGLFVPARSVWVKRPVCARALMDTSLTAEIRAAHAASKDTYEHHVCRLILRKPAFVSVANVWRG
jgi:hypothetical protein